MRHSLLSLLFIVASWITPFGLSAQQPFPTAADEPRWGVAWYVMGQYYGIDAFQCSGAIDVCGRSYDVVTGINPGATAYFRNDEQRTLIRKSTNCDEREYLLYDFSLNVGDTAYVGWEMEGGVDTSLTIVEAIDTIDYLGVPRRRFSILIDRCPSEWEEPLFTTDQWIEGVGSIMHPFYSLICLCDFCETGVGLLCADSSGVALHRYNPEGSCDRTIGMSENMMHKMELRASMDQSGLHIQYPASFDKGMLNVTDALGRTVIDRHVIKSMHNVDLPALGNGAYVVLLSDGRTQWYTRCIGSE